jgi:hypothetical protein
MPLAGGVVAASLSQKILARIDCATIDGCLGLEILDEQFLDRWHFSLIHAIPQVAWEPGSNG